MGVILEDRDHYFPPDFCPWSPWRHQFRADKQPNGKRRLIGKATLTRSEGRERESEERHFIPPSVLSPDGEMISPGGRPRVARRIRARGRGGWREPEEVDGQATALEMWRFLTWFSTLQGLEKVINYCWIRLTHHYFIKVYHSYLFSTSFSCVLREFSHLHAFLKL